MGVAAFLVQYQGSPFFGAIAEEVSSSYFDFVLALFSAFLSFHVISEILKKIQKDLIFMPHRTRNTQRQILPKTPTSPPSHPSLFFSGSEIEPLIGEPSKYFEDHIGEEEEDLVSTKGRASPILTMDGIQRAFPIREADGETKMKNISPSALPHFHGLTSEDPDTFMFEFFLVCRTYDYTSDDQKLKLFSSILKNVALR